MIPATLKSYLSLYFRSQPILLVIVLLINGTLTHMWDGSVSKVFFCINDRCTMQSNVRLVEAVTRCNLAYNSGRLIFYERRESIG